MPTETTETQSSVEGVSGRLCADVDVTETKTEKYIDN